MLVDATEQTWHEAARFGLALSTAYAVLARVVALAAVMGPGSSLGLALRSRRWSLRLAEILRRTRPQSGR